MCRLLGWLVQRWNEFEFAVCELCTPAGGRARICASNGASDNACARVTFRVAVDPLRLQTVRTATEPTAVVSLLPVVAVVG
jgi:hypothetical protein